MKPRIPFVDLQRQYLQHKEAIDAAAHRVLASGRYILGTETAAFEQEFSDYLGVKYSVGVANGTDALTLALMALDVGRGDEVITVSHSAVATVAGIERSGAKPVFVDIDPVSFTIDPARIVNAITNRTKAIVPVHLYGCPAQMPEIMQVARAHNLFVIEDCAQAHGALCENRKTGTFGDAAAFSFYPTKNLGAAGDGGMVSTDNREIAERLYRLRQYGWNQKRVCEGHGVNSRLDELQAAILRIKLATLDKENDSRRQLADRYKTLLTGTTFAVPVEPDGVKHVYHLFVIRAKQRELLLQHLHENGITAQVHYSPPVHLQKPYQHLVKSAGILRQTEQAAHEVVSLPIFPAMQNKEVEAVCEALVKFKV